MSRNIDSHTTYVDRVAQLIPSEVVAAHLTIQGLVYSHITIRDIAIQVSALGSVKTRATGGPDDVAWRRPGSKPSLVDWGAAGGRTPPAVQGCQSHPAVVDLVPRRAVTGALTIHNRGRSVTPPPPLSRSGSPNRRRWIGLPGFWLRAHPGRDHGAAMRRPNGRDQVASWSCADCRPSRMGAVPSRGCERRHANRGRLAPVDPLVLHRV